MKGKEHNPSSGQDNNTLKVSLGVGLFLEGGREET